MAIGSLIEGAAPASTSFRPRPKPVPPTKGSVHRLESRERGGVAAHETGLARLFTHTSTDVRCLRGASPALCTTWPSWPGSGPTGRNRFWLWRAPGSGEAQAIGSAWLRVSGASGCVAHCAAVAGCVARPGERVRCAAAAAARPLRSGGHDRRAIDHGGHGGHGPVTAVTVQSRCDDGGRGPVTAVTLRSRCGDSARGPVTVGTAWSRRAAAARVTAATVRSRCDHGAVLVTPVTVRSRRSRRSRFAGRRSRRGRGDHVVDSGDRRGPGVGHAGHGGWAT